MKPLIRDFITHKHGYHLVDPSPWPIFAAFSTLILTLATVLYMHTYKYGGFLLILGVLLLFYSMFC